MVVPMWKVQPYNLGHQLRYVAFFAVSAIAAAALLAAFLQQLTRELRDEVKLLPLPPLQYRTDTPRCEGSNGADPSTCFMYKKSAKKKRMKKVARTTAPPLPQPDPRFRTEPKPPTNIDPKSFDTPLDADARARLIEDEIASLKRQIEQWREHTNAAIVENNRRLEERDKKSDFSLAVVVAIVTGSFIGLSALVGFLNYRLARKKDLREQQVAALTRRGAESPTV
jgi:hypothetical protein